MLCYFKMHIESGKNFLGYFKMKIEREKELQTKYFLHPILIAYYFFFKCLNLITYFQYLHNYIILSSFYIVKDSNKEYD